MIQIGSTTMLLFYLALTGAVAAAVRLGPPKLLGWANRLGPVLWIAAGGFCLVHLVGSSAVQPVAEDKAWMVLSGLAIVALPVALTPSRWRVWCAAGWGIFLALLAWADLLYLRFFGSLVTLEASREAHQLWDLRSLIADLTKAHDAWLLIVPLAAGVMLLGWRRGSSSSSLAPSGRRLTRLAAYGALVLALGAAGWPVVREIRAALESREGRSLTHISKRLDSGFLNAHLIEASRSLRDTVARPPLSAEDRLKIDELHDARAREAQQAESFGVAAGSNLLLIQVEALSSWVLGLEVGGKEVTPFLNSLSQQAVFYPFILDQTREGRTSDAEYLVLNSQHSLPSGAVSYLHRNNRFVALPAILGEAGYTTLSAHAYKRGFWNRAILHPKYGFESSLFERELGFGERLGWGLRDGDFFRRMVPELEALPEPFMAFLITLSMHPPYQVLPPAQKKLNLGQWEGTELGGYLELTHYFDGALREFFDLLEARGLLRNTVVALYGDHTAGGLSRQEVGAAVAGREDIVGWPAAFQLIPFFLRYPDQGRPEEKSTGRVETVGGLLDIGPTLQHLLGVERPRSFLGRPLLDGVIGRAGTWNGRIALGEGLAFVKGKCTGFPKMAHRRRVQCRRLRLPLEEERLLSHWVTAYDLAEDLRGQPLAPQSSGVAEGIPGSKH